MRTSLQILFFRPVKQLQHCQCHVENENFTFLGVRYMQDSSIIIFPLNFGYQAPYWFSLTQAFFWYFMLEFGCKIIRIQYSIALMPNPIQPQMLKLGIPLSMFQKNVPRVVMDVVKFNHTSLLQMQPGHSTSWRWLRVHQIPGVSSFQLLPFILSVLDARNQFYYPQNDFQKRDRTSNYYFYDMLQNC